MSLQATALQDPRNGSRPARPESRILSDDRPAPGGVFISYAQVDGKEFATRLHDDLERAGVKVFLDERDIKPGQNIDLVVRSNLINARAILAVLTPGSVLSDYVGGELFRAYEDTLPVIPLLVADGGAPQSAGVLKALDFRGDYAAALQLLLRSLATLEQDWIDYLQLRLDATRQQQQRSAEPQRFAAKIERLESIIANRRQALAPAPIDPTAEERLAADRLQITGPDRQVKTGKRPALSGAPLPDIATHFRDRQAQIRRLENLLSDRATRIVTILGRGGIGKTALVANVLLEPGGEAPVKGVACLSARTRGEISLEEIFTAFGDLLGPAVKARLAEVWSKSFLDLPAKATALLNELVDGRYLLLLDNVEAVLDKDRRFMDKGLQAFIEAVIAVDSNLVVVLTSRVPLALRKELLIFDRQIPLTAGLPERDAIAMLRDLDTNGSSGLRHLGDEKLKLVVELVKGLPRALELVAYLLANDPLLSFADLLDPNTFFRGDDVMQELVAGAYSRIDQDSLMVLQALAVFGRMVSRNAIEFLLQPFTKSAGVGDILRYLVQTHVVSFSRDTATFDLHPLDREYLARSLPAAGDYSGRGLHRRAAEYYVQVRKPERDWRVPADLRPQMLEFKHRVNAEQPDEAAELLAGIDENYLEVWGYNLWLVRMRRELAAKPLPPGLRVQNLVRLARAEHRLGHFEQAIAINVQARTIAHDGGDRNSEATCLNYIGNNHFLLGHYALAIAAQREAVELAGGDRRREAACLNALGNAYNQVGQFADALAVQETALRIRRELGKRRWISDSLQNIGEVYYNLGELQRALEYVNEELAPEPGSGQWSDELARLTNGSALLIASAQYDQAKRNLERALVLMRRSMEWRWEDVQRGMLGDIYRALGDYPAAATAYQTALDLATSMKSRSKRTRHLVGLGTVSRLRDDPKSAVTLLTEALQEATAIEDATQQLHSRNELAMVHLLTGKPDEAARVLAEGLRRDVPLHYHRALLLSGLAAARSNLQPDGARQLRAACSRGTDLLAKSPGFIAAEVSRALALVAACVWTPAGDCRVDDAQQAWQHIRAATATTPGLRHDIFQLRSLLEPLDKANRLERFPI
jgi:tetratricopeptide (TPR) repeat protein